MEKRGRDIGGGLSSREAEKKLIKNGLNEIQEQRKKSLIKILFNQVKNNFVIYLLLGAMILSFFVGKNVTSYTIMAVIILVVTTGFIQEYRADKAIKSLRKMISPVSLVLRDGKELEIPASNIVTGDVIVLRTGEKIPADLVVLESSDLRVNESILTGESQEVVKTPVKTKEYQRENTLFMGTFVVNGRCTAQVIYTGMNTKFGKIANLISKEEKELPLQKKINQMSKYVTVFGIILALLAGTILFLKRDSEPLIEILIVVIALAVAAFPEGFPVTLLTTLSSGAYRMAKNNAIVNRMSIIETLGETTVICSDKTGTITKGEMTVKSLFLDNTLISVSGTGYEGKGEFFQGETKINTKKNLVLQKFLNACVYCNDSKIERTGEDKEYYIIGNPTEAALLILAAKDNVYKDDLHSDSSRIEEIPFNSERKLMSVLCETPEKFVFTKGAPEILLSHCKFVERSSGVFKLTERDRKNLLSINDNFAKNSYRTLGIAYKKSNSEKKEDFESDLVFLGLIAMEDPPRIEVKEAISSCLSAGIKVKMITGDNKETALSISKQIGLLGSVLTGDELEKITDSELARIVNNITIFARVKPEHKLRIVNALKKNNEIVTMTGDGVNDAPALKAAHIGVAMGKSGTDVCRDVADLTLKDDNFATIVSAVSEGRTIFNNMRKFVTYELSCTGAEQFMIIMTILLGLPLPFLAIQILFMNLVTSDLPAITLGLNPSSKDIMQSPPRKKSSILTKHVIFMLSFSAAIMALLTLGVFFFTLNILSQPLEVARTTALVFLIVIELANAFNFRSFRKPVLTRSPLINIYLVYASAISILATILIIYTPLSQYFMTYAISLKYWVGIILVSLAVIIIFDILKAVNHKLNFWDEHF